MSTKIQHIAVMRLSAMGDVAMTVPVLKAFVNQNPEIKITVVSDPFFRPFFEGISDVSFFAFDEKERHKGFFGVVRLYQDLEALHIDAFADLHNVLRSKLVRTLFAWSGKKTAFVDKGRAEKEALTRPKNKIFKPLTTMCERHVEVFKKLGFKVDLSADTSSAIVPQKIVLNAAVTTLIGGSNQKLIGIAPFAQYESKVYPLDLMQEVIKQCATLPQYKILLFGGGQKEIEQLNLLASSTKNTVVIAGKLDFKQELQLISTIELMLSMDSGNGHIAAMMGVKVITLWGATHPYAGFSPYNQPLEHAIVADRSIFPKLPTSVYGNKKVTDYQDAMRSITVQSVMDKIRDILQ